MKIIALIPALNEAKQIASLVQETKRHVQEVVVVDDGSTDGTSELAAAAGARVLSHPQNQGKGKALQTGFQYVLQREADGCLILDGDGQHSPQDIPLFLKAASEGAGVVVGNRMGRTERMPLLRRWTNRFMSSLLSSLLHEEIPDSQCGFRFIRSDVLSKINLETAKYEIDSEILVEARRNGFRIASVPIQTLYQGQKSKIHPLRDTWRFVRYMIRVKRRKTDSPNT